MSGQTFLRSVALAVLLPALVPSPPPLWLDTAGHPTRNARDALNVLSHAADEGLDPADYRIPAPDNPSEFDAALTAAMQRYLRHLHMGRIDPAAIGFHLDAPRDHHDFAEYLRTAVSNERVAAAAADLRPPIAQYGLLRDALARYRALAADSSLTTPIQLPPVLRPGDDCASIAALRHLLVALGDLPETTAPGADSLRYDGALVEGVKHFQARHGLDVDGVIGAATAAALRVPMAWRVRQIELSLERLRWLPHLGDSRLIVMNIPMFRLWTWNGVSSNGVPLFGMDVIVGKAALDKRTPVFMAAMKEVIFRPFWNVPDSILYKEELPKI